MNKILMFLFCSLQKQCAQWDTNSASTATSSSWAHDIKKIKFFLIHREFCNHDLSFLDPILEYLIVAKMRSKSQAGTCFVFCFVFLFLHFIFCLVFYSLMYTQKSHHLFPFCCFLFQILSHFTASVNHHLHCLSPISAHFMVFHTLRLLGKTWLHTEGIRDQRPGVYKLIFSPCCIWHIHMPYTSMCFIPTKTL